MSHMKSVAAIVTTGIYCRAGCGARPNPENRMSFPLAAAAEAAGYRACLRCRPYRSAQLVPTTAPELVCRAVRMILDGAGEGPDAGAVDRELTRPTAAGNLRSLRDRR